MNFLYLVFSLFILMDSVGNIPLYVSLLKDINPQRQRVIIIREMIFALIVIALFAYAGDELMAFLHIQSYTILLSGGIILFLIAIKMIFPTSLPASSTKDLEEITEPFFVPLAVPLVAGPGVLSSVMLFATQFSFWLLMGAVILAWLFTTGIMVLSPYLSAKMGKRALIAIERLMGLILVLLSVDMFCQGIRKFTSSL